MGSSQYHLKEEKERMKVSISKTFFEQLLYENVFHSFPFLHFGYIIVGTRKSSQKLLIKCW